MRIVHVYSNGPRLRVECSPVGDAEEVTSRNPIVRLNVQGVFRTAPIEIRLPTFGTTVWLVTDVIIVLVEVVVKVDTVVVGVVVTVNAVVVEVSVS